VGSRSAVARAAPRRAPHPPWLPRLWALGPSSTSTGAVGMARRTAATLGAVAAFLRPARVQGNWYAMATCAQQRDCMEWSLNPSSDCSAANGQCSESWEVCVTVRTRTVDHPNCPKADKGFSHYCDTVSCYDAYPPPPGAQEEGAFPFTQCQHGGPGQYLYFVFKDGPGCGMETEEWSEAVCETHSYDIHCFPRPRGFPTCSDYPAPHAGKECIWKVRLPPVCPDCECPTSSTSMSTTSNTTTIETTPTTTSSSPTTSDQESMPPDINSMLANPFDSVHEVAMGNHITVGTPLPVFLALAGVFGAVAGSIVVLSRRARARASARNAYRQLAPAESLE